MKITQIQLKNFRCYRNLDLEFPERISLLFGANGSGKSSLLDAVRVALLGEVRGCSGNEGRKQLATWGENSFRVELEAEAENGFARIRRTPSTLSSIQSDGKAKTVSQDKVHAALGIHPRALEALFDVNRAIEMPADERKALAFALAEVDLDSEALEARGLTSREVRDLAAAGAWAKARRKAEQKRQECHRAIKEVREAAPAKPEDVLVGDPEHEQIPCSEVDDELLERTGDAVGQLRDLEHDLVNRIASLRARAEVSTEAAEARITEKRQALEELRPAAVREAVGELRAAFARDQEGEQELEDQVAALRTKHAEASRALTKADEHLTGLRRRRDRVCPHCQLCEEHAPRDVPDEEAIAAAEQACTDAEAQVKAATVELRAAEACLEETQEGLKGRREKLQAAEPRLEDVEGLEREIHDLEKELAKIGEGNAEREIESVEAELSQKRGRIELGRTILEAVARYREQVANAEKAAGRIEELEAEWEEWDRQEKLCRPDGIQAEFAKRTLEPIRERLRRWDELLAPYAVQIRDDFEIVVDTPDERGIAPELLSFSERWRAALAVADAFAQLSKLRLLYLDELPQFDPEHRAALFHALLDVAGDYDQVVVSAVIREEAPEQAEEGSGVCVYGVADGRVTPVPAEEPAGVGA